MPIRYFKVEYYNDNREKEEIAFYINENNTFKKTLSEIILDKIKSLCGNNYIYNSCKEISYSEYLEILLKKFNQE